MTLIEALAYALSLGSMAIVASGRRWGFLLAAVNFFPWAVLAWNHHMVGLIGFSGCISLCQLRSYFVYRHQTAA